MRWKVKVEVTLKKGIHDPQGSTVENALEAMEFKNIERVRMGKYLELYLAGLSKKEAGHHVEEMCRKLLVNPVIEEYTYTLEPFVENDMTG